MKSTFKHAMSTFVAFSSRVSLLERYVSMTCLPLLLCCSLLTLPDCSILVGLGLCKCVPEECYAYGC